MQNHQLWRASYGVLLAVSMCACASGEAPFEPQSLVDGGSTYDAGFSAPVLLNDGGTSPSSSASALPANVCKVLQDNGCVSCHKHPLAGGAPLPLLTPEDFAGGVAQKVLQRVQDAQRPMPPATTGRPLPPSADVAVLKSWIEAGTRGEPGIACSEAAQGSNDKHIPGWAKSPWPEGECEWVLRVGAHGKALTPVAQDTTPFAVPAQETSYECFYEAVPWGDKKVQAIAMRVNVDTPDDLALVHHLVISGVTAGQSSVAGEKPDGPGDHKPCENPSGSTVGVWAPGESKLRSHPGDVGVLMPSGQGAYLEMQVHYNNPASAPGKQSRVSYDLCVTSKLRTNEAGVHWLGFENANVQTITGLHQLVRLDNQGDGRAIGRCTAKKRARILWMAPHMHELGRHTKVEILRKNGSVETVLDKPFDFREQTAYYQDNLWVEEGETVRTTCKWDTSRGIHFGFASEDEMCFVYTLAYPAGALAGNLGFGVFGEKGFVGGELACAAQGGP